MQAARGSLCTPPLDLSVAARLLRGGYREPLAAAESTPRASTAPRSRASGSSLATTRQPRGAAATAMVRCRRTSAASNWLSRHQHAADAELVRSPRYARSAIGGLGLADSSEYSAAAVGPAAVADEDRRRRPEPRDGRCRRSRALGRLPHIRTADHLLRRAVMIIPGRHRRVRQPRCPGLSITSPRGSVTRTRRPLGP